MFSVEVRFKVGDREVSLERFATLFLKELLKSTQEEIRREPARVVPQPLVTQPAVMDGKETEPRAVGLKQAAYLLGVSEHTIRAHVLQRGPEAIH